MKKVGAFIGKFYPPHIGHINAIDKACKDTDILYIIISKNDERNKQILEKDNFEILDAKLIKSWFVKHYKNNPKIKVGIFDETNLKPYPQDQDKWAEKFKKEFPEVNVKIADESYREFNQKYFPEYEFYPIDREKIDIHSSYFRKNKDKYLDYLIDEAKEYFIKKEKIIMKQNFNLDHVDIVTSHMCNRNCRYCVDKFIHTSTETIKLEDIEKFLQLIRKITNEKLEVLLLGGEPTVLPTETLIEIANLIHKYDFSPIMSTNGLLKDKIIELLPYYDWIQVTVYNDKDIDFYKNYTDKINIKLSGDASLTMEKLNHFIEYTKDFKRRSVSMYFTVDFKDLCTDKDIWALLDTLDWKRNGSYVYSFYKGVRFKKCIPNETNIIDEPTVPKLYPNGNYNKTWNHEELDDYLNPDKSWNKRQ